MTAVVHHIPDDPSVLHYIEIPDPSCPPDSVLIRVEAISIEGGDLISRASAVPPTPNYVPGYAAAGEIVAVGSQVHDRLVGQKVTRFDGSHAAMRAVKATRTWLVPAGPEMAAAAALPINAMSDANTPDPGAFAPAGITQMSYVSKALPAHDAGTGAFRRATLKAERKIEGKAACARLQDREKHSLMPATWRTVAKVSGRPR